MRKKAEISLFSCFFSSSLCSLLLFFVCYLFFFHLPHTFTHSHSRIHYYSFTCLSFVLCSFYFIQFLLFCLNRKCVCVCVFVYLLVVRRKKSVSLENCLVFLLIFIFFIVIIFSDYYNWWAFHNCILLFRFLSRLYLRLHLYRDCIHSLFFYPSLILR